MIAVPVVLPVTSTKEWTGLSQPGLMLLIRNIQMNTIHKAIATFLVIGVSAPAMATPYVVTGTTLSLNTQGIDESQANYVKSNKPILNGTVHPWCGNSAYIDRRDTAILAAAMTYAATGQAITLVYDDAKPSKWIAGVGDLTCKVINIYN